MGSPPPPISGIREQLAPRKKRKKEKKIQVLVEHDGSFLSFLLRPHSRDTSKA